ncbi:MULTISPECIES: HesB/YadR/YfhF family protein [unclassified Jeotgalibaca]|uniref:HesB/YadR/YfhF family protein n=1 Tax=unclassified Jeotgalibaca TaxID=2621505 RepID=UPI003FCFB84C
MKITIDERAQKWFEEEIGIPEGEGIRFLGKVYGSSPIHEGFSIGIAVDKPKDPLAITTINGIPYFIDKNDDWFFSGYDLEVVLDDNLNEPEYIYHETKK